MGRKITPEMMDDPDVGVSALRSSLAFLRRVNRRLGGQAALLGHLSRWSAGWERGATITLLDVATGSADLPVAARRWALEAGFDLRITAIDRNPSTLEHARDHVRESSSGDLRIGEGISLLHADALALTNLYPAGSFDYVHAGLFLHHLSEVEILTMLRIIERLARRGIIWNDLVRSTVARVAIHLMTIGRPLIVRHDARVSVAAGFTRSEVLDYAQRLDLGWCRYQASFWSQRFTLSGEKPWAKRTGSEGASR